MELASLMPESPKLLKVSFEHAKDFDRQLLLHKVRDLRGHEKISQMLSDYVEGYYEMNATSMKLAMELLDSVWLNVCMDFLQEVARVTKTEWQGNELLKCQLTMFQTQPSGEETSLLLVHYVTPTDRILQHVAVSCISRALEKKVECKDAEKKRLIIRVASLLLSQEDVVKRFFGEMKLSKDELEVVEKFKPLFEVDRLEEFIAKLQK